MCVQGHCRAGRCPGFYRHECPPAVASPHPMGTTAAPSSAPSAHTSKRVGVAEPAPTSKYQTATTVISYFANTGAPPALLLALSASCDTQAVTWGYLCGCWPGPQILSPRRDQNAAPACTGGAQTPGERPTGSTSPVGASRGSLITACRERRD